MIKIFEIFIGLEIQFEWDLVVQVNTCQVPNWKFKTMNKPQTAKHGFLI